MKKGALSIFQIFILIVGVVAISYVLEENLKIVSAYEKGETFTSPKNIVYVKGEIFWCPEGKSDVTKCVNDGIIDKWKLDLSNLGAGTSPLPTSISKSQKYYEEIFGKFSAAPKGATGGSAEKGYTIEGDNPSSSGFGYSVSNIIGNAAYAAGIFIFIKSVGGMFVDDDGALTKALSGAAFGGIVGKVNY